MDAVTPIKTQGLRRVDVDVDVDVDVELHFSLMTKSSF